MSQIRKALLGAVATALTLGAVQYASGHDLVNRWQAVSEQPSHIVNRAGKADHLADRKPFRSSDENGFAALERSRRYLGLAAYSICAGPHHQAADAAAKSEP
ncbi:hypothetical protein ACVWXN_004070 [Bradyrhizobium sp. i1.4.4]